MAAKTYIRTLTAHDCCHLVAQLVCDAKVALEQAEELVRAVTEDGFAVFSHVVSGTWHEWLVSCTVERGDGGAFRLIIAERVITATA